MGAVKREEELCAEERGATEDAEFIELSVGELRAIPHCAVQLEVQGVPDVPTVGQRDAGTEERQEGRWGKSKSHTEVRKVGRKRTDRFNSRNIEVPGRHDTAGEEAGIRE